MAQYTSRRQTVLFVVLFLMVYVAGLVFPIPVGVGVILFLLCGELRYRIKHRDSYNSSSKLNNNHNK